MKYIEFNGRSSMVDSAAYDPRKHRLFLRFNSDSWYGDKDYYYDGVKPHAFRNIVDAFENGRSVGRAIHANVNLDDGVSFDSDHGKSLVTMADTVR